MTLLNNIDICQVRILAHIAVKKKERKRKGYVGEDMRKREGRVWTDGLFFGGFQLSCWKGRQNLIGNWMNVI